MNFELTADQTTILSELSKLTAPFATVGVTDVVRRHVYSQPLQDALIEGGYFDLGNSERDSTTSSALIIAEIAKLPVTVETTGSALVRPAVLPDAAGPVALIQGNETAPARFLPYAKTVLILSGQGLKAIALQAGDVEALPSLFGFPMGRLTPAALARAEDLDPAFVEPAKCWWRVGVALEIAGALAASLKLTVEHVIDRQQFGRPLGSFQAIQHRLATSSAHAEASLWLALKAANTAEPIDAMIAAGYAQNAVKSVSYDCHQFSGAMGLTLEYALHLFTYRAKLLQSELGGSAEQMLAASNLRWEQS